MILNKEWLEGPKSPKLYQESEEKEETIIVSSCVRTYTSADRTRNKIITGPTRGRNIANRFHSGFAVTTDSYNDLEKIFHRVKSVKSGKSGTFGSYRENCSCKSPKFPSSRYDDFKLPVKVPIIFAVKHPGLIYDKSVTTKRKEAYRKFSNFSN